MVIKTQTLVFAICCVLRSSWPKALRVLEHFPFIRTNCFVCYISLIIQLIWYVQTRCEIKAKAISIVQAFQSYYAFVFSLNNNMSILDNNAVNPDMPPLAPLSQKPYPHIFKYNPILPLLCVWIFFRKQRFFLLPPRNCVPLIFLFPSLSLPPLSSFFSPTFFINYPHLSLTPFLFFSLPNLVWDFEQKIWERPLPLPPVSPKSCMETFRGKIFRVVPKRVEERDWVGVRGV